MAARSHLQKREQASLQEKALTPSVLGYRRNVMAEVLQLSNAKSRGPTSNKTLKNHIEQQDAVWAGSGTTCAQRA